MINSKLNMNETISENDKIYKYTPKNGINVLFLHNDSYLFPIPRVHIMAEALVKFGYDVNVICSDEQLSPFQIINGVKIWNIYKKEKPKSGKYIKFLEIKKRIEKKSHEFNPDVIQIFSPLLIPLAIKLKKEFNSKLIYDCYEYWIGSGLTSKRYYLAVAYALLHFLGFFYLDGIIFVYKKNPTSYFIDFINAHFKKNTIFKCIIYNVPQTEIIQITPKVSLKYELFNDKNRIIIGYLGLVMKYKGYEESIECLSYLDEKYVLLLIGDAIDPKFKGKITKLIDKYDLRSRVYFTGLVPHTEAMKYLSNIDLALLLFRDTLWTRYSLPNKLFEYMALGIPIIASDIPNLRYYITKNNCGIISRNNPKNLSENIKRLAEEKKLIKKIRQNSKKFFKEKYSEDIQMQKLLKLYSRL
jgi:glycosyltransferase involved in cell wall biosynthesis